LAELPSEGPLEVAPGGKLEVKVKVARREEIKGAIRLAAETPSRGITVRAASIPPAKDEATVTITTTNQIRAGHRENIIITGTLRVGQNSIIRFAPAIPIKAVAPAK
jgi:hypothetical protein